MSKNTTLGAAGRHDWAAQVLDIEPADHLLEIGCGHGVTASLAAQRLRAGRIVGIDRSPTMIEMALRRNAAHCAAGRAEFRHASAEDAKLGEQKFDNVFAFHVAGFWRRPSLLLDRTRTLLAPGGALYLFNQLPGWNQAANPPSFAATLVDMLAEHGFAADEPLISESLTAPVLCVRSRPTATEHMHA